MTSTLAPERTELSRFFTVAAHEFKTTGVAPQMFSPAVDAAWHRLINTPGYRSFCTEHAGQPIGHAPTNGTGPITWIGTYEALFGPLSEVWFTDADGKVNHEALDAYRSMGTVVAEWDCSPVPGDAALKPTSTR